MKILVSSCGALYHVTICSVLLYLIVDIHEINIIYNLRTKIFKMCLVKLQRVTKNILLLLDDSDPHRSGAVHYHELEDRRFFLIKFRTCSCFINMHCLPAEGILSDILLYLVDGNCCVCRCLQHIG